MERSFLFIIPSSVSCLQYQKKRLKTTWYDLMIRRGDPETPHTISGVGVGRSMYVKITQVLGLPFIDLGIGINSKPKYIGPTSIGPPPHNRSDYSLPIVFPIIPGIHFLFSVIMSSPGCVTGLYRKPKTSLP